MPLESKTLHLFTTRFPFGNTDETFLETEIHYLSRAFNKVIIHPSFMGKGIRNTPENVEISKVFIRKNHSKKKKITILAKNLFSVIGIIRSEVRIKGAKTVYRSKKILLEILSEQLLKHKDFNSEVGFNARDVYYDYWFENSTLMLALARKKGLITKAISRGHGFDIYDERWKGVGVPFRQFKMKHLDTLYVISSFGSNYIKSKTSIEYEPKIKLSRLGIEKHESFHEKKFSDVTTVVSCSNILDFKQVDQIPKLLQLIDLPLHWIHFGDGPCRFEVEKAVEALPKQIKATIKGRIDNEAIIDFYKKNKVDLFISLSSTEGLPVSMMEAQSFGIPIASYPSGGIPEIVINEKTGFLIDPKSDLKTQAETIKKALSFSYSKTEISAFFDENFNASVNYTSFTSDILQGSNQ